MSERKYKWYCVPSWTTLLMETFFPWATFLCVQASNFFLKFSLGSKHLKSTNRTKSNCVFCCPWLLPLLKLEGTLVSGSQTMTSSRGLYHLRKTGKRCFQQSQGGVFCRWSNRRAKITWWSSEWPYYQVFESQKRPLCKRSPPLWVRDSTTAAGTWDTAQPNTQQSKQR